MVEVESTSVPITASVSFPDTSGGTPGFALFTANNLPPYPQGPFTITQAMLRASITTQAGKGMIGFGEKHEQTFSSDKRYARVWLKLNDAFPSSIFRVRFNVTLGPEPVLAKVKAGTVARGKMRAGLHTDAVPLGSSKTADRGTGATTTDYRINPSTLEVTGPF